MISVYCNGVLDRADARLQPQDITAALDDFRKLRSIEPERIYLNSKMKPKLEGVVPDDIEIKEHNGVLSWEVWLEGPDVLISGKLTSGPLLEPPSAAPGRKNYVVKTKRQGQIRSYDSRIKKQALQKPVLPCLASKQDVSKLNSVSKLSDAESKKHPGGRPRKEGTEVSRSTLWRRQKRMQGVLPL